jgi:hypothetical protein
MIGLVPFLEGVVAFIVIAGTVEHGVSLWLRHRAQRRPELDGAGIETLREENSELRTRVAELEERVDFVERRLVREQPPLRLPNEPERTPV